MAVHSKSRPNRTAGLSSALVLVAVSALSGWTLPAIAQLSPPSQQPQRSRNAPPPPQGLGPESHEHLAQWMSRHSNLSLPEQQRALEREPGFRELSPQVQQRMRDRLTQLNMMSPDQRERVLARTEAMEHLDPVRRQQVRGAMTQLSSLPPDRRRLVARAFREIRDLPPNQRQSALTYDPRFREGFTDEERSTLAGLVAVEPFLPAPPPSSQPLSPQQPQGQLPIPAFRPPQ